MRTAPLILSLVLLAGPAMPAAAQSGRVITERWRDEAPQPRGADLLRTVAMDLHDRARAKVRVAPLAWDDGLARDAAAYAAVLARSGRFEHARQDPRRPQGENLWMGTKGAFSYAEMVQGWVDERRWFVNGPVPRISRTANWADVGHYTQIIWSTTTRVGCAMASNAADDYLVCRYSPAGNVYGVKALP